MVNEETVKTSFSTLPCFPDLFVAGDENKTFPLLLGRQNKHIQAIEATLLSDVHRNFCIIPVSPRQSGEKSSKEQTNFFTYLAWLR